MVQGLEIGLLILLPPDLVEALLGLPPLLLLGLQPVGSEGLSMGTTPGTHPSSLLHGQPVIHPRAQPSVPHSGQPAPGLGRGFRAEEDGREQRFCRTNVAGFSFSNIAAPAPPPCPGPWH